MYLPYSPFFSIMNIQIPFEIGYVQQENGNIEPLEGIEISINKNGIFNIAYFNDNTDLKPVKQSSEEEYKAFLQQKEQDKIKSFQHILDVFDEVFNSKDWDYSIHEDTVQFLIKYESFKIENNKQESHTIKDLFVRIKYGISTKRFFELKGIRKTLNFSEYTADYGQSHMDGSIKWSSFCLGEGGISSLWDSLQMTGNSNQTDDLKNFLFSLYPYLMWENLEATPWRFIQRIKSNQRILTDRTPVISTELIEQALKKSDISRFIHLDTNTLEVSIPDLSFNFLREISENIPDIYKCYVDDSGSHFSGIDSIANSGLSTSPNDQYPVIFKGQEIKLKVLPDENILDLSTFNRVVSPSNVNIIVQYIITEFNKTLRQSL